MPRAHGKAARTGASPRGAWADAAWDHATTVLVMAGYALTGTVPAWVAWTLAFGALAFDLAWMLASRLAPGRLMRLPARTLVLASTCGLNLVALAAAPQVGGLVLMLLFAPLCRHGATGDRRSAFDAWWWLAAGIACALLANGGSVGIATGEPAERAMLLAGLGLAFGRFLSARHHAAVHATAAGAHRESAGFLRPAPHGKWPMLDQRIEATHALQAESERADRCGTALWAALVEVDHLGQMEGEHGQAARDGVLSELYRLLDEDLRSVDHVFRWSGSEFLLLLVGNADADAKVPLERIRAAVERHDWKSLAAGLHVTVSIGMSRHRRDEVPQRLLRRVDSALDQARSAGNRLHLH